MNMTRWGKELEFSWMDESLIELMCEWLYQVGLIGDPDSQQWKHLVAYHGDIEGLARWWLYGFNKAVNDNRAGRGRGWYAAVEVDDLPDEAKTTCPLCKSEVTSESVAAHFEEALRDAVAAPQEDIAAKLRWALWEHEWLDERSDDLQKYATEREANWQAGRDRSGRPVR